MNEYDQRQYQLMQRCLEGFGNGNLNLRVLIDSLKSLINFLQEPKEEWKSSFNREWFNLEEIYSIASDCDRTYLSQEDQNSVYETVGQMKKLLQEVIRKQDQLN
jgi:hypothetical protein